LLIRGLVAYRNRDRDILTKYDEKLTRKVRVEVDTTLRSPYRASPPNFQNRLERRVQFRHYRHLVRVNQSFLAGAVVPLEVLHYRCREAVLGKGKTSEEFCVAQDRLPGQRLRQR
jgi:hypothetical protein